VEDGNADPILNAACLLKLEDTGDSSEMIEDRRRVSLRKLDN